MVKDLIKTTWDYYDPHSNYNRIGRLEEITQNEFKTLSIHQELLSKLTNQTAMNTFAIRVEQKERVLSDKNWNLLQNMKNYIEHRHDSGQDALREMIHAKAEGFLSVTGIAKLANYTELLEIRQEYVIIDKVESLDKNFDVNDDSQSIKINFQIITTSETAHVYQYIGIPHWISVKKSNMMNFVTRDPELILYDDTIHCVKRLHGLPQYPKLVTKRCTELNYFDPELKSGWKVVKSALDPRDNATAADIFEQRDRTHSYIYCFPFRRR